MAMIGPRPIDTVGYSQKSGISQGCGYDDRPPPSASSWRKFFNLSLAEPAFEKCPRINARRGVAGNRSGRRSRVALAVEEMVEGDFIKRGGGGKSGDVAADGAVFLVGPDDHRHRVPADDALDAAFDFAIAGVDRLLVGRMVLM